MNSQKRESATDLGSHTQQLATILLGEDVRDYVVRERQSNKSWRGIALSIYDRTNGRIDVTYETVRNWYAERRGEAA